MRQTTPPATSQTCGRAVPSSRSRPFLDLGRPRRHCHRRVPRREDVVCSCKPDTHTHTWIDKTRNVGTRSVNRFLVPCPSCLRSTPALLHGVLRVRRLRCNDMDRERVVMLLKHCVRRATNSTSQLIFRCDCYMMYVPLVTSSVVTRRTCLSAASLSPTSMLPPSGAVLRSRSLLPS